ncbi:major facilitator superfamily transporter [Pleomassaria siparia CBS 279.74]|uniref:Major facilitator superfamily transporter n=1 Tax=Pleomassaria siparia CBS 279.74 TaxID=1314801 RepID=A0A6G1KBC2_9PLEO|nr:major facilitator superfamily transporter [Pleomassaria siparia CBS 279.74]
MSTSFAKSTQNVQPTERTPLLSTEPTTNEAPSLDSEIVSEHHNHADPTEETPTASVIGVLVVILIGTFVANLDTSFVMTTHGTIATDFERFRDSGWVLSCYTLAMCATQPIYGKLSNIYGRKSMLTVSYSLFAFGCLICGTAATYNAVLLGRVLSGLGGAGMSILASILITDLVPLRQVASWRSYLNIFATTGRSIGGPVGGYLADTIGWRWSFAAQCPLILLAMSLGWFLIPAHTGNDEEEEESAQVKAGKLARVDFLGSITLAAAIVSILLPLELGGEKMPWNHPLIVVCFVSALFFGLAFVLIELYWAAEPIFPLFLLARRDVVTAYLAVGFLVAAQISMMIVVPLYFRITKNVSNSIAGAHLVPTICGNALGALLTGITIRRTGRYKPLMIFATLFSSSCYALLVLRWHGNTNTWESLYIFPGGFGTGIIDLSTLISLTADLDNSLVAIATSGLFLCQSIGVLSGISVSAAVTGATLRGALDHVKDLSPVIKERAIHDIEFVTTLKGAVHRAVVGAYIESFRYGFCVSVTFGLMALCVTIFVREHKL